MAQATDRSIVLYDVPYRTGVTIAPDAVKALLAHENIAAIRACVPSHFCELGGLPLDERGIEAEQPPSFSGAGL